MKAWGHPAILVYAIATYAQIAYGLVVYMRWGHTFVHWDAFTHSYISRMLWEGIQNIGGVWLPLFAIITSPLTLIRPLYTSGLDGLIVNSVATGLTAMLLYKLQPNRYGLIVAGVFAGNFLTLTYSSTPLQQSLGVLFAVWAIYYFKEYLKTDRRASFVKMAAVLAAGSFARYEVWALAILLVVAFMVREARNDRLRNLAFAHLGLLGIFMWLFWDMAIFRDPLFFLHAPVGRLGGLSEGSLATANLLTTFLDVVSRVDVLYFVTVAVLAFALIPRRSTLLVGGIIALYGLSLPIQAPVYGVEFPFDTPDQIWNVHLERVGYLNPRLCCPAMGYSLAADVRSDYREAGRLIHSSVLISTRVGLVGGDILSILGGVDVAGIIDEHDPNFRNVSRTPWSYAEYVIISKEVRLLGRDYLQRQAQFYGYHFNALYYLDENWRGRFLERYQPILENDRFIVYERIATVG
jgi:hypothetical protein